MRTNNRKFTVLLIAISCAILQLSGIKNAVRAQSFDNIQQSKDPLILKAQGSFYVGGELVEQTRDELGSFGPGGHISINQVYVHYMIPPKNKISVVMIHGMSLTGKCWETTPDGRMGWDEYFVRKNHSTFVIDQVGRGRSGFNQAAINQARVGAAQTNALPALLRFSDEVNWPNFRIGLKEGNVFPNQKFPVEAIDELSKQGVPDLTMTLPNPNPTYKALADLSVQVKGAVLISHSQSGSFPLETALINSAYVEGIVMVEPGFIPTYNDEQIKTLATKPILIVYGDNLAVETGIPGHNWKRVYDVCLSFIDRVKAVGGNASMIYLPEKGILGNSHMIMQDKNSLQVADLIMKWVDENVGK